MRKRTSPATALLQRLTTRTSTSLAAQREQLSMFGKATGSIGSAQLYVATDTAGGLLDVQSLCDSPQFDRLADGLTPFS